MIHPSGRERRKRRAGTVAASLNGFKPLAATRQDTIYLVYRFWAGRTVRGGAGYDRVRRMGYLPAGKRSKWLVLVFWLVLVAVAGPLSGKLTGAEKNNTSA
jgi:hypothetical protein